VSKIKCFDCFELTHVVQLVQKNHIESLIDYVDDLRECVEINDEEYFLTHVGKVKCSFCNAAIDFDGYFIPLEKQDDLAKRVCQFIGEGIAGEIEYCSMCEIVKELESVNRISQEENGVKRYSEGRNINDFLEETFGVPHDYTKYVIPYLSCMCCGYGFEIETQSYPIGKFNDTFKIFDYENISDFLEIDMDDWKRYADDYDIFIRRFELSNFLSYLKKNQMIGFKHPVGQSLHELFSKIYSNGDYLIYEEGELFRGRTRSIGTKPYESSQMWNPPFGVSSHGRYNFVGISVLYLTDNKDYIPYEVNLTHSQELDIATVKIKKPLIILDLSKLMGGFGRYLSQSSNSINALKLEYLLTNYISECCKDIGFHGIKYKGVKEGNYYNYSIINFEKDNELEIVSVKTAEVAIVYSAPKKMVKV
jgi:hypothetical protein